MACVREYEILVKNALGDPKFPIYNEYAISWALKLNKPGSFTMDLPSKFCTGVSSNGFAVTDIAEDDRIELWRTTNGVRKLVGDSPFFVNKISSKLATDGRRVVHIEGETALGIFGRRYNAYGGKDANQNYKAGVNAILLDAYVCELFRKNMGTAAKYYTAAGVDNRRRVDGYVNGALPGPPIDLTRPFIACNPVAINGPSTITTDFETTNGKTLLALFQQAADYSASKNENFFVDCVQVSNYANVYPHFQLRSYVGQRGVDRSATVTVGDVNYTLSDYELLFDYTGSARVFVSTGKNDTGFAVATAANFPQILATDPFALRELVASSGQTGTALQSDADRNLQSRLPVAQLTGSLVPDEVFIYGVDYDWGDKVSAFVEGAVFNSVFVDTEEGSLSGQRETLKIGVSTNLNRKLTEANVVIQQIIDYGKAIAELQSIISA
ncbi:MAG TPA: hypothetical protein P5282_05675 [Anaerolineaceae bacterium]|nr:hypothetical protein [Myxococcota bacterium]HRS74409.1 hypothetical protein [Anaerolineaceae bacterium]HRV17906.1 hypothetical protein [Myxococcota bacterium]